MIPNKYIWYLGIIRLKHTEQFTVYFDYKWEVIKVKPVLKSLEWAYFKTDPTYLLNLVKIWGSYCQNTDWVLFCWTKCTMLYTKVTLESQMSVHLSVILSVSDKNPSASQNHNYQPSTNKQINHQSHGPSYPSEIMPIFHHSYWPSYLSTIMPIAYRPSCLPTIMPICHVSSLWWFNRQNRIKRCYCIYKLSS